MVVAIVTLGTICAFLHVLSVQGQETCYVIPNSSKRMIGGNYDEPEVATQAECEEQCTTDSICLGISYNSETAECLLYDQSPATNPDNYVAKTEASDPGQAWYQKAGCKTGSCGYTQPDPSKVLIGTVREQPTVTSLSECEDQCTNAASFNCRSLRFTPATSDADAECLLYDTDSGISPDLFIPKNDQDSNSQYYERNACSSSTTTTTTTTTSTSASTTTSPSSTSSSSSTARTAGSCVDKYHLCAFWAYYDQCRTNPDYMFIFCPSACGACPGVPAVAVGVSSGQTPYGTGASANGAYGQSQAVPYGQGQSSNLAYGQQSVTNAAYGQQQTQYGVQQYAANAQSQYGQQQTQYSQQQTQYGQQQTQYGVQQYAPTAQSQYGQAGVGQSAYVQQQQAPLYQLATQPTYPVHFVRPYGFH